MTETAERNLYELLEGKFDPDETIKIVDSIKDLIEKDQPINKVAEFMDTFNQTRNTVPTIPTRAECGFRLSLISEETIEIAEACGSEVLSDFGLALYKSSEEIRTRVESMRETLQPNKVACLDGFEDLKYVLYGTILKFGMQNVDDDAFDEVHNSNMSKACDSEKEAHDTMEKYSKEGIETEIELKEGRALILRSLDKKVLKSINYKPAQLDKFIYESV